MYRRRYESRRSSKPKLHFKKTKKLNMAKNDFQYGGWNSYTSYDYDIDFARWLHPAMWHVVLESWQLIHQAAAPCNVIRGSGMTCRWIRPVAAPCNVIRSFGNMTLIRQVAAPCNVAGGSGMTCHWIRPNVRHIGILHLISISTVSPQSACHSAPVCEILFKSDHPWQKKIRHVDFQDGGTQPSWILGVQYWVLWKAHVRLSIGRQ